MWIVAVGNPFDGITLYGPFATADEANEWADCSRVTKNLDWWILNAQEPT